MREALITKTTNHLCLTQLLYGISITFLIQATFPSVSPSVQRTLALSSFIPIIQPCVNSFLFAISLLVINFVYVFYCFTLNLPSLSSLWLVLSMYLIPSGCFSIPLSRVIIGSFQLKGNDISPDIYINIIEVMQRMCV